MINKKVDGLRKINRQNQERSKEIILDVIGEKKPKVPCLPAGRKQKNIKIETPKKILKKQPQVKKEKLAPKQKKKKEVINIRKNYSSNLKRGIYLFFMLLLLVVVLYLIFFISVIKLNIDNSVTRYINNYFPVPGILTDQGMIKYYDIKDSGLNINEFFQDGERIEIINFVK